MAGDVLRAQAMVATTFAMATDPVMPPTLALALSVLPAPALPPAGPFSPPLVLVATPAHPFALEWALPRVDEVGFGCLAQRLGCVVEDRSSRLYGCAGCTPNVMRSPDGKPIGVRPAGITTAVGEPRAEQITIGMCGHCVGHQHCSRQHANDKHAVPAFQALTSCWALQVNVLHASPHRSEIVESVAIPDPAKRQRSRGDHGFSRVADPEAQRGARAVGLARPHPARAHSKIPTSQLVRYHWSADGAR